MNKIKVLYDCNEYYPFYEIYEVKDDSSGSFLITEEEYKDYCRVMEEFNDWQDKIEKLVMEIYNDKNTENAQEVD